jgi:uncharacterized repeat protein (TIGR03803 family)
MQGSDGNFYGTTYSGGASNNGTVFRISPSGNFTNLYSFSGVDGYWPFGGLVQGSDGNFYGTTRYGGTSTNCYSGCGTVFKLSVPLNRPANQIAGIEFFGVFGEMGVALWLPSVAGETYRLQYSDSMVPTNWFNTGGSITSSGGSLTLFDLTSVLPTQRFYRAVITP